MNGLFVDAAAKAPHGPHLSRPSSASTLEWPDVAYDAKRLILDTALASELNVLANQLARIARPTATRATSRSTVCARR